MTVLVRGATSAYGGTLSVPAGVVAGDLLIASLRSFWQDGHVDAPFAAPGGWIQVDNRVWGEPAGGDNPGGTWGNGTYVRVVDGSEPAAYTWTVTGGEAIFGGIVALYSTATLALASRSSGTASGPSGTDWISNYVLPGGVEPGALVVHVMTGYGTAVLTYSGFTGPRTHHASLTLHSETPFTIAPIPPNPEMRRDMAMVIETEAEPLVSGTRVAHSNSPGPLHWFNLWFTVWEIPGTAPPPAASSVWNIWAID